MWVDVSEKKYKKDDRIDRMQAERQMIVWWYSLSSSENGEPTQWVNHSDKVNIRTELNN